MVPPWREGEDPALEADLREIRRVAAARNPRDRRLLNATIVLFALAACNYAVLGWMTVSDGFVGTSQLVVGVLIGFSLTAYAWSRARGIHARDSHELRDTFLERSRCPACAYGLSGLGAEADGCVVCPECGAAWRPAPNDQAGTDHGGGP